jgi:PTS system nitrogen regulatory IIA component
MQLSHLLKPEAVKVLGHHTSKKRLFQDLGDMAALVYKMSSREAVESLQERESLGPTGVGHGIALPHARIEGLESVCGIFIKLEKPIEFGSVDKQPIDLVFALFAPTASGVDHLKALALVSRTMREEGICTKLRANSDPATLYVILTEGRTTQAA